MAALAAMPGALPRIPDMPAQPATSDAERASSAGAVGVSADAGSASVAAASTPAAPAAASSIPFHLIPPSDVQLMLESQAAAIASLRTSNARFVKFHEDASRAYDHLYQTHAMRVAKVRQLRDALMDVFVRVRHVRMRLHERAPGALPYREEEETEAAEVEQLKQDLRAEELMMQQQQQERALHEALTHAQEQQAQLTQALAAASITQPSETSSTDTVFPALVTTHTRHGEAQLSAASAPYTFHPSQHSDNLAATFQNSGSSISSTGEGVGALSIADSGIEGEENGDVFANQRTAAPSTDPSLHVSSL